jgi:hypothetical protein
MLKSIQCLFLISISIAVLAKPVLAEEQKTSKVSTEHQTLKLYKGFFPYQACLLVTITQVVKKPDRVLLLKATVEDVYLGSYKKGSQFAVSLYYDDEGPISFSFLSAQKNARQIIAFNHWTKDSDYLQKLTKVSKNPIRDLWIPYAGKGFQLNDIAQIKALTKNAPTEPAQKRAAFQRFLETKWTPDRINDFCRPETRRTYGEATWHAANYQNDWHISPMHADKKAELGGKTVDWQASVDNNTPTQYNITVSSPSTGWDLEHTNPSLEEWTDVNFLIHRVGYSINQAAWAHWRLNHELHPSSTEYRHLIIDRSKETVVKDKTGKVTSYQCRLSDGTTLTAILTKDKSQSIDRILINGKLDSGWTNMYKNGLRNLAKCDKH